MYGRNMVGLSRRDFLRAAAATGAVLVGVTAAGGGVPAMAADGGDTQVVTDMGGTEVTVPSQVSTYADAWYAHNEISIMLNGAQGLVATHCTPSGQPWMFYCNENINGALQTFGDDFNYEELVGLGPQVVFDSKDSMRDKLGELGVPLVNCMFTTFEDMERSILLTAQVLGGDAPSVAQRYNDELEQVVASVGEKTDALSDDDRPSVMHGASVYTFNLDGTDTIIDTWIRLAGGKNAVDESTKGNAKATFSLEQVIAWDPDVIITGKAGEAEQILADPDWSSISAVRNGAVYTNPKGVFPWDRYGAEELLQVQWAAALLHPELFGDIDIEEKIKGFYSDYLRYDLTDEEVSLILAAENPPSDGEASSASLSADGSAGSDK